ncbi:MAG: GTP-binding protein HSR1 [Firmicutes bacterium]|nr:GTP-binding protein HSR1 [Bacillota bacterium]
MKKSIIVGKTNAGKTLFMINFAEYIGLKKIVLKQEYPDGKKLSKEMSTDLAKSYLSSDREYKTQCIQSICIDLPVYKGKKEITLLDTSGLIDGIHPKLSVRNGIIQTLEKIQEADIILHMLDIALLIDNNTLSEIDRQIIEYGRNRKGYVLIPNKIDLDKDKIGLHTIRQEYPKQFMIPISALYKKGFDEVKAFVIRSI